MYDTYMTLKEACAFLGIGRNTGLRLCQERTHNFPVVRVGRRYQIDAKKLETWKEEWFAGQFEI